MGRRYRQVLGGRLTMPDALPSRCKSLVRGLLNRDPAARLGSAGSKSTDLMRHPVFAHINWVALEARELKPPFDPGVAGALDTRNFDPEVTAERVPDDIDAGDLALMGAHGAPSSIPAAAEGEDAEQFAGMNFVGHLSHP